MLRCIRTLAWVGLMAPLGAAAFEAVDVLTPSTNGRYPAYPSEGLPLRNFYVQAGGMYDSNILRRPSGDNADFVSRVGVGARGEQRIVGRQRFHYEANVDGYVYNQFSAVDNIAWGGLGEWQYEVGNDLSGVIGGSLRQFQASLAETQRDERDRITEGRLVGTTAYRLGPHARVRGGLEFLKYKRPLVAEAETNNLIGTVGADWVTDLGNTLGAEYRSGRGDAPVDQLVDPTGIFVNNDYRQHDAVLTAAWLSSPYLRFAGSYGITDRKYTVLPGRDYRGPTWMAAVDFLPGNKTILSFEASRHITSLIEVGASHAIVTGYSFGPSWAVTAKVNLIARLMYQKLDYEGDPAAALGLQPVRVETLKGGRIGAYWEYDRQWHWQAAFDHGTRGSNYPDRGYTYNAVMANVRYNFW